MMRSESTRALGQPRETNEIFGAGAFMRKDFGGAPERPLIKEDRVR
jgi:hypothetical protein